MAGNRINAIGVLMASAAGALAAVPASASDRQAYQFDLPAQNLGDALRAIAAKAGWELYASADDVNGVAAPSLHGSFTPRQAIEQLVRGTNLSVRFEKGAVIIRGRPEASIPDNAPPSDIVVTGSRISGAPPAAPVTTITAEDIKDAGQSDLGEVARSLPMNFGGGQNPGIGNSQGFGNENANANGASTFNLRGIGPNATLTLLNGNRLSYSGISAAIDVSAIPIEAVDRVEIVADGASAIYGADAVAGVVNIILKPDYSGLTTGARLGGSTDGGNFQQQYDAVGGARWSKGGFIAAYDFSRNTAIKAEDRSYASSQNPQTSLFPEITRHSVLLSAHQDVSPSVTLKTDFIYKTGSMNRATGYLLNLPITDQGLFVHSRFETLAVVPSIDVELPHNWTAKVTGTYGIDKTISQSSIYSLGAQSTADGRFNNESLAMEAGVQGPLFALPAGDVRLAIGGGARRYRLVADNGTAHVRRHRNNYFAYAELYAPLVSPAQDVSFVHRASLTGALRLEDYSDSGRVITPKVGIIYDPVAGLSLKATWGRSFKLPTLYQQYSGYAAILLPVSGYGDRFPSGATYIQVLGSNEHEQAEHSESWVLSAEAKPLPALQLSASYFHIDYTDRIAPPLLSAAGALTNPATAGFVTVGPTAEQIASIADGALGGLLNGTGRPYDSDNVVAILDIRDRNIARQIYHGIDLSVRYGLKTTRGETLVLTASGTWLKSDQQLLRGSIFTNLAGTIFHPPHFKARGGATFNAGRASVSAFVNYTGNVADNRRAMAINVGSMTTIDLTAQLKIGRGTQISFNALNLFDAKPGAIYTTSPYDTPFDTTNYSAVGRFLSLSISHSW